MYIDRRAEQQTDVRAQIRRASFPKQCAWAEGCRSLDEGAWKHAGCLPRPEPMLLWGTEGETCTTSHKGPLLVGSAAGVHPFLTLKANAIDQTTQPLDILSWENLLQKFLTLKPMSFSVYCSLSLLMSLQAGASSSDFPLLHEVAMRQSIWKWKEGNDKYNSSLGLVVGYYIQGG